MAWSCTRPSCSAASGCFVWADLAIDLPLQGERKVDKEIKEKEVLRREMFYGYFRRALAVPDGIKAEQIKAKYHDGVLEITAPIKERYPSKKIEVRVEKSK